MKQNKQAEAVREKKRMRTIGITGGVGAGKSAVLQYLKEQYGAYLIIADELAKELEQPGHSCYEALVSALGAGILAADDTIDKAALAALIFSDEAVLRQVNAIVHPAVKTEILRRIAAEEERGTALFIVEAALLIEEHYDEILDELWYVYAAEAVRRERLKRTRGYSDDRIDAILAQQRSEEEFRAACRYTIDNSGSLEEMRRQVDALLASAEGASG